MIIRLLTAAALAAGALLTAQTASASPATDALLNALNGVGCRYRGRPRSRRAIWPAIPPPAA
jgi:hypothetical protein